VYLAWLRLDHVSLARRRPEPRSRFVTPQPPVEQSL
jgi:hypothetical protein